MRTRTRNLKRLLSLALCLCMVTGLLPVTALAANAAPAITTATLAEATVGEAYTAQLTATASDQNGTLTWEVTGLPNGLALTGSGKTAALIGTPTEAGNFSVTVTVTETIPAVEPEKPAEEPAAGEPAEGTKPDQGTGPAEGTDPAGPTVLTDTRTYTLTVAEPAGEPANEPPANAPLTDDGSTRTTYQSVNATIYTGQGSYGEFTGETSTFAVDQSGLILDLRDFNAAVPSGWSVESISFYPTDGSDQWGTVFWFDEESLCTNGTKNDKLYVDGKYNGVFQILNFAPNGSSGSAGLTPGAYKVLVYVGNGLDYPDYKETLYLSNETFTITEAAGPGKPVISTGTLPNAYANEPYTQTLQGKPGTAGNTLTWSISDGSLPAGLSLDSGTGTISGTPTAEGTCTFTVKVTETPTDGGETLTATKQFTLKVATKLEISTESGETTFELTRGKSFSLTLQANMDVTWRFQAGYIPGLRLSGGTISGTVSSSTSSGTYTATIRATAADGQTADLELTFIVGDLFAFTLPTDLDPDAYDHYAYLLATQNSDGDSTLWSGTLRESSNTLVISSRFSGETVTDVKLAVSLKGKSDPVVLASAEGPFILTDGEGENLDAVSGDVIATLPKFDYGELGGYVTACYKNADNYCYYPGDLAAADTPLILDKLYINRTSYSYSALGETYNLDRDPTFWVSGEEATTYTPGSGSGPITVTFPKLEKKAVTFTLQPPVNEDLPDLSGSRLSIQQYVNGKYIFTEANVNVSADKTYTYTAELYLGLETTLSLRNCLSNCGLVYGDTIISSLQGTHKTLQCWTSKYTSAGLMLTTKLADNDELLRSYANYLGSFNLTIGANGKSWSIGSLPLDCSAAQSRKIWNSKYSTEITKMIDEGSDYTLSWSASSLIDSNKTYHWEKDSFSSAAELPIHFKGGVLLELDNGLTSGASMQDWWYSVDADGHGSWISGKSVNIHPRKTKAAFYCPGADGTYGFILLPREAQPTGMTWKEAAEYFQDMPSLETVVVKTDTVIKGTGSLTDEGVSSSRYLTLPNSTLSGPAQFSTTNELLSYTGGIQLDDGVGGKLKSLRIDAAGTDGGGRVAFQINSLQINGKTYPYAGIHLISQIMPDDTLVSEQFQTYYLITFDEPISLPCTFSIYGNAMTPNSNVKLTFAAELADATVAVTDEWQPLGTITTQAPSISVTVPSIVGTETATAYLTLPGSNSSVDIYDGETLVVSGARKGEVAIPLVGTSPSRVTTHNLSFRWHGNPPAGASSEAYEVTVLHANGAPTLTEQLLQTSYGSYGHWATYARDTIYSYASARPPHFRAVCTIENSENISGDVYFLFYLLDGSVEMLSTDWRYDSTADIDSGNVNGNGDVYVSKPLRSNSPVISVSVLYEINWDNVEKVLRSNMPLLPADSPSRSMDNVTFTETVVVPYQEHNIQFNQIPTEFPETSTPNMPSQKDLWDQIQALQAEIEEIYEEHDGQAGFYIIDIGHDQFMPALEMIDGLDTEYISQGETGTTTMTRPLTREQLETELGSGDWSRYTFTEPGESGGGETTTGMEIYTQSVSTESGVEATITIATNGEHTVEFATARGEGTGTESYSLPRSGTYDNLSGAGGFSFTNFGSDGMSVFTETCGDVAAGSNTIRDITAAVTGAEATGLFKPLEQGLGAYSFGKDMMDGMNNQLTLADLLNAPNNWLSSPCAQKLPAGFRKNMENQIDQLIKDVRDAEGWNMAVTGANYVLGAGGLVGMFSNPVSAAVSIVGGAASWFAGKITSQKITNVQQQATLLKDIIDMKITQTAISTNDRDCLQKSKRMDRDNTYRVCIDPSGVVYEAVLSNPVESATVTLYTADGNFVPQYAKDSATDLQSYVDKDGKPITPNNVSDYSGTGKLSTPAENSTIPGETVLTTGADGKFQWMVEQGLWYVIAYKDGYEPGNSGNDVAAVVEAGGLNWLPVAPEQTNVNIPLVSFEPPTVTAEAREDGVYLIFSKYMDEDTLKAENFTLTDSEGNDISVDYVQLLNREKAPANINYLGAVPSYTSQVKLWVNGTLSGDVTVTIDSAVESYAGVPCASTTAMGTFSEGALVDAPEVEGTTGQVEYGATVTLSIPDGAVVYYTTDESDPSFDSSGQPTGSTVRYYKDQQIIITKTMTLKAVAVKYGVPSAVTSVEFTVPGTGGGQPEEPEPPKPTPDPGYGGSSDSSGEYLVNVGKVTGGKVLVNPGWADEGDTVTLTVKPNSGYALSRLTVTDAQGSEMKLFTKDGVKYTFIMPDSRVTVKAAFSPIVTAPVNPFTDVSTGDYYYNSVLWAVANGVTSGASATTFAPNATVTRAQAMTFLWRAHGSPKATGSNPFTDVSASDYYYDAVLWAVANGVTSGTSATTFSPDAPVTRAQAVTFQWRAAGSPVVAGDSFDDVAADAYYAGAVTWAVANGITNGTGAGKFSPDAPVTRAQAVTFLWRELA